jgi:Na+-transporting methylmalonyl-CoA/oxaloacetate decarboxylase gamma subunit
MYIRGVSDLSVICERGKILHRALQSARDTLTFEDVSNIIVDLSSTNLAAVICALLRSSFKSFCRSPVISYHQLTVEGVNMFQLFLSVLASSFHFINEHTITFKLNDYFPRFVDGREDPDKKENKKENNLL